MNEEGAFHQGRRNKEMKRKQASNRLLLLPPAPWLLFIPLQDVWEGNKGLCKKSILSLSAAELKSRVQGRNYIFIHANVCVCVALKKKLF